MRSSRSGITIVELVIAICLLGLLFGKASTLIGMMRRTSSSLPARLAVNDKANMLVDRIALAILGSDRDALFPQFQNPVHTSSLRYNVSLGVEDGEVVWSDPEEI